MKVKALIDLLQKFSPDADVRVGISWPDRVTETYDRITVTTYESGPVLNAAMDFKGLRVFVGCEFRETVKERSGPAIDLGDYPSVEIAAKVRDFYVINKKLGESLNYPDFDYDHWIPPRTTSGEYNRHIAEILREKLMRD